MDRLRRDRVTLVAAAILLLLIALAAAADLLANNLFHYGFTKQDLLNGYQKPTLSDPAFWFGGDDIGRSQIVRLLYGARVSLSVAIGAAVINLTIGLTLGLTAGFLRGWFDDLVQFVIKMSAVIILAVYAVRAVGGMDKLNKKLERARSGQTGGPSNALATFELTRPVVEAAGNHLEFDQIAEVKLKGFSSATELFLARPTDD